MQKFIIRQPEKADREFASGREALQYLVSNPGYAKLYYGGELVMTKGISPYAHDHDASDFRGIFRAGAEA